MSEAKQRYREKNQDKFREYARQYYYRKNDQTLVCPVCESIINKYQVKRHEESIKYQNKVKGKEQPKRNINPKPKKPPHKKTLQPKQSSTSLNYSNDSECYDPWPRQSALNYPYVKIWVWVGLGRSGWCVEWCAGWCAGWCGRGNRGDPRGTADLRGIAGSSKAPLRLAYIRAK